MRKVVLYIAASLDNFIARPNGDTSWLHAPELSLPDEDFGYSEFYDTIDTILMGHETYKVVTGFDIPYPHADRMNYIFSRSHHKQINEFTQYVSGDIVSFAKRLKKKEGKDIWLVGGSQINTLFLENNIIDQLILTIIPMTLGSGIPLFEEHTTERFFELEKTEFFRNGMVQLVLNIKKEGR